MDEFYAAMRRGDVQRITRSAQSIRVRHRECIVAEQESRRAFEQSRTILMEHCMYLEDTTNSNEPPVPAARETPMEEPRGAQLVTTQLVSSVDQVPNIPLYQLQSTQEILLRINGVLLRGRALGRYAPRAKHIPAHRTRPCIHKPCARRETCPFVHSDELMTFTNYDDGARHCSGASILCTAGESQRWVAELFLRAERRCLRDLFTVLLSRAGASKPN